MSEACIIFILYAQLNHGDFNKTNKHSFIRDRFQLHKKVLTKTVVELVNSITPIKTIE